MADVGKNEYKESEVSGFCATITAGCTAVGQQAFAQSDLATLKIEYAGSDLAIGKMAFKKLDLTVRMECEAGCGNCTGANNCTCSTRRLDLDPDWHKDIGSVVFEASCAAPPAPPSVTSAPLPPSLPPLPPSPSSPPSVPPPPLSPLSCSSPGGACLAISDDNVLESFLGMDHGDGDFDTVIPGDCAVVTEAVTGIQKGNAFRKTTLKIFTVEFSASPLRLSNKMFRGLEVTLIRVCETGCGTCTGTLELGECTCNTRGLIPAEAGWQQTLSEAVVTVEAACATSSARPPPAPCSPPPLTINKLVATGDSVSVQVIASGVISDYGPTKKSVLECDMAVVADVACNAVTVTVTVASVLLNFVIVTSDPSSTSATVTTALASTTGASTKLGVSVQTVPVVSACLPS